MTAVTLFPLEDKYKKGRIIPDEYSAYINGMCVGIIHSRKDYRQKYYFHSDNGIYANYSATLAEMKRNIAKGYEETVREGKFKSGNGSTVEQYQLNLEKCLKKIGEKIPTILKRVYGKER